METDTRIMVVDDEIRICENVEKILKKNNYRIEHATSADEALRKMAKASYTLLISDIIMPEKNGLELLKIVKAQWPLTKAVMMTAYASTDTAVKAIRMGALDYLPKPFTPDELRNTVAHALSGELMEVDAPAEERQAINVIDIDIPFDRDEVARYTGDAYADRLGPSDMPIVEVRASRPIEHFCAVGDMVCDIFKKLGATCKAGVKTGDCPQKKAKKGRAGKQAKAFDADALIGVDAPFSYREVTSITGPEYIRNLRHDGVSVPYYEVLRENVAKMRQDPRVETGDGRTPADAIAREARSLGTVPSDAPAVEITATAPLENFCEVGDMVCDIFKKLGATCKVGTRKGLCPQKKAEKANLRQQPDAFDGRRYLAPELPFEVEAVAAATGPGYMENLVYDGVVQLPYEKLKASAAHMTAEMTALNTDILIIDDEASVNNNIRKILAKKGLAADQALTRDEALAKISARAYKLVLLDLKIPGVNGLELLKAVVERHPKTRVVVITGYASIETAVETARMGAIAYLPKPFTPAEIRTATDQALRLAA